MKISNEDGDILVRTSRLVVKEFLKSRKKIELPAEIITRFSYNSGIFVTITQDKNLRGCIGFPTPERKLYQSLIDASIASATEDPRFSPVRYEELNRITFEITVLTPPMVIKVKDPSEYPSMIKVGRDGLIIKWEFGSGLLLPQVPNEYGWNEEEFLGHACTKAGASPEYWKQHKAIISKFEGFVFRETKPNGLIKRIDL